MDIIELIIDANIVIAIILNEPSKEEILRLTAGKIIVSTEILPHEVGNALSAMYKKKHLNAQEVLQAYANFEAMTIRLEKVYVAEALKIACDYGIYAYDAYYLEAARRLRLPLLTLDGSMHKCAGAMREDVFITRRGGNTFRIVPVVAEQESRSPLDVPGIQTNITLNEILETVRECRGGESVL